MPKTAVATSWIHWREVCRSYAPGHVKSARLGGDGQDQSFESAFSNLAHAFIQDKAPSLLDHEQGFQLLDRNQDNTKAVGVFGFRVGSNQLMAPVFFLQGDLKGHELLYLKSQDMFVPMKENWLNYLLNRKPNILGSGTGRNTSQLGVLQPNMERMRGSSKSAMAIQPWAHAFMPKFASLVEDGAMERELAELEQLHRERLNLPRFLKQAGTQMLASLVSHMQDHPSLAAMIDEMHGLEVVSQAIKMAKARDRVDLLADLPPASRRPRVIAGSVLDVAEKRAAEKGPKQKLKVLTYDTTQVKGRPEGLSEADQEKLLKEHVLIKDDRGDDEVSIPYNVQTEKKLFNPTETGLYLVLVKEGEFEQCLVVINPHGPNGRRPFATVVRTVGEHNWINYPASEIWATSRIEGKEYDAWYDGLPAAESFEVGDKQYVLVGPRGSGTMPFKIKKSLGEANDTKSYEVRFSSWCDMSQRFAARYGRRPWEIDDYNSDYSEWRDGQRVHLNGKDGTELRSNRGDLYVPKGYKKVSASVSEADAHGDEAGCGCAMPISTSSRSETPPIRPGDLVDAELALQIKTAELKIVHDGHEVWLNDGQPQRPLNALVSLVRDHGFREPVARHMLKRAEVKKGLRVRVKYADPYMTQGAPSAPGFPDPSTQASNVMGYNGPTQEMQENFLQVPGMHPSSYDRSGYDVRPESTPAPMDQQSMGAAQQSGQRELMDTAMIGSTLKAVRDDTMIDQYLPDLIKGMDRKGRLLFQYYWNGDRFAERYGKSDMPELEDALRNAFEMDGDVVLFLKQKTIEPHPEQADAVPMDLHDVD